MINSAIFNFICDRPLGLIIANLEMPEGSWEINYFPRVLQNLFSPFVYVGKNLYNY